MKTLDQLDAGDRRRLTGVGLRAFWELASRWSLTEAEQIALLGIASRSTLLRWRNGEVTSLRRDTLERLSLMFGIFMAINQLLGSAERADEWMRRPNNAPVFAGKSALQHMLSGRLEHLYETRRYLDAVLNG